MPEKRPVQNGANSEPDEHPVGEQIKTVLEILEELNVQGERLRQAATKAQAHLTAEVNGDAGDAGDAGPRTNSEPDGGAAGDDGATPPQGQ